MFSVLSCFCYVFLFKYEANNMSDVGEHLRISSTVPWQFAFLHLLLLVFSSDIALGNL